MTCCWPPRPRLAELNAQDIYKTTGDLYRFQGRPRHRLHRRRVGGSGPGPFRPDVPGADAYYASVVEYVQKAMDENGRLNRSLLHREFPPDPGPDGYG